MMQNITQLKKLSPSKQLGVTLLIILIAASSTAAFAAEIVPRQDFTEGSTAVKTQTDYVIITLTDPPAASYTGNIPGRQATKPGSGKKLNPADPSVKAYVTHLADTHKNYRSYLAKNAPQAEIVREFSYVANGFAIRLKGTSPEILSKGPGVRTMTFSTIYHPTMDVSPGLIDAPSLWNALGGPSKAGQGIKIGIIDTGIDITNPFLGDSGYPPATQTDACSIIPPFTVTPKPGGSNTNNKVIICRVFASGVVPGATGSLQLVVSEHGTHVAGTAAGNHNTDGTVEGTSVVIHGMSGVAPQALLGDYNVFPGFGVGFSRLSGSAFSHDIAAALEAALLDGMDVASMSLGGTVQGPHDFLADAVNSAVDGGMVVAVAAGNSGPGDSTIESPGSAENAITVSASTNPHFIGIPATLGTGETFGAAVGQFNSYIPPVLNAEFALANPSNGCIAFSGVSGKIALIDRGTCTFTTKVRNAQSAGAIGVIVINNVAGDPVAMAQDGTTPVPTIPAAMVSKNTRVTLVAAAGTTTMNVDGTSPQEFITTNADIIAGFSSRGPTPFTFLIKPDVTAPGVNVVSSVFNGEFAFFQGTSMATPHVSGTVALLRQLHPDWSPDQIKSALVNTAKRPVFRQTTGTGDAGVLARGGGRIDLAAAMNTPLTIQPASASFGKWTGNKGVTASLDLKVVNVDAGTQSCTVSMTGPTIVTASTGSISLSSGGSTTLTLTLNAGKADQTPSGDYDGDAVLSCGTTTLEVPWWVRIDREAIPAAP